MLQLAAIMAVIQHFPLTRPKNRAFEACDHKGFQDKYLTDNSITASLHLSHCFYKNISNAKSVF